MALFHSLLTALILPVVYVLFSSCQGGSVGPSKMDEEEEKKVVEDDAKKRKLNLQAVRAAVRSERNGDMFSEGDLFPEKYLVSEYCMVSTTCTCITHANM